MRILFIGGTRFVGLAIAREALRRGHVIDVFHRGTTSARHPDGATHLLGDRSGDVSALARGDWDAVVDACAYRPHEIDSMAATLAGRFRKYVFVSTVSVYADELPHGADESGIRAATIGIDRHEPGNGPIEPRTYGPLKVLCEDVVLARHVNRLIVRPTFVIGPDDYTQRFPEWVRRIAAGGVVDAPGPRDAAIQYIDARDLAAFVIDGIERDLQGTFNTATPQPPFSFGQMLDAIVAGVAPSGTTLRWLSVDEAKASAKSFPLWTEGESVGKLAVDAGAALARGLTSRPLRESARDVLEWTRQNPP
ncbi:MAG: NAD-dependent epimerase/dehydratase family protein [Casimicrobiaceae bacterium]